MNRYLVFAFDHQTGGWHDFRAGFDTIDEANGYASSLATVYWHVVDAERQVVISAKSNSGTRLALGESTLAYLR